MFLKKRLIWTFLGSVSLEEKNRCFPFTLGISNGEIILSVQEQEKDKKILLSYVDDGLNYWKYVIKSCIFVKFTTFISIQLF